MKSILVLALLFAFSFALVARGNPLVYEGDAGPGKGKHLVFIASDHEYRSEETLPALARILAKHHGFKCTVVFGVNEDGVIVPGFSNVPGIEVLRSDTLGVPGDAKEAIAFAILGNETMCGLPSNVPSATGAAHAVIIGKIIR